MFAFDFSGSGRSDGEYVSLGFFEREDLKVGESFVRVRMHASTHARVHALSWGFELCRCDS